MPAKKATAKTRRAPVRPRARRVQASASAPAPAAEARSFPGPEGPKSFPLAGVVVGVLVLAGLCLWGWHHAKTLPAPAAPAPAPAPAASAPAPAPTAPALAATLPTPQPSEHARPASTLRRRPDSGVLALAKGRTLSLRCWRPKDGRAELEVFGRRNHRVRSILSPSGPAGWVELAWNGRDDAGKAVPAGRYFARPSQKGDQLIVEVRVKD